MLTELGVIGVDESACNLLLCGLRLPIVLRQYA